MTMALFNRKRKPTKLVALDELDPMIQSGQPVLLDFMQVGCGPCQIMDGIVNELADEYADRAHVVKVDVTRVAGAAARFNVRSTPTFVILGSAPVRKSKKAQRRGGDEQPTSRPVTERYRSRGLVKKDALERALRSAGVAEAPVQS
jgi:thiol-disulfide isomerase/thioredoxin